MSENFILELKLEYSTEEKVYLDKIFWCAKNIYNNELNRIENRYKELIKTKLYRQIMDSIENVSKEMITIDVSITYLKENKNKLKDIVDYGNLLLKQKEKYKILLEAQKYLHNFRCNLINSLGISEYDIQKDMKRYSYKNKTLISSNILQKIATNLAKSLNNTIYKYKPIFKYKSIRDFNSIEGKDNKNGIVFDSNDLVLKVGLKRNKSKRYKTINLIHNLSEYELKSLRNKICYCRIIRKDNIRGKSKYYLQLVMKGAVPIKDSIRYSTKGRVGIDTGLTTMAVCSENKAYFVKLSKKSQELNNTIINLQSYIDKSKKITNPNKYNENGTYKRTKEKWVYSNRCKRAIIKLRDFQRKQKAIRKEEHNKLANYILTLGNEIYIEPINYKGLAKRGKTEETKSRKRFGKSINKCAPALFLNILKNKAQNLSKTYKEINTKTCKASQYNHIEDKYIKEDLDVRVKNIGGYKVQRDLYSAFLIMNVNEDLKVINRDRCNKTFDTFIENQNEEITRIRKTKEDNSPNFGLEDLI